MESAAPDAVEVVASAELDKRLFIEMLTRDIELIPAILDFWDNSIDGAMREFDKNKGWICSRGQALQGHKVSRSQGHHHNQRQRVLNNGQLWGIPLDVAVNYAFRFGRAKNAPSVDQTHVPEDADSRAAAAFAPEFHHRRSWTSTIVHNDRGGRLQNSADPHRIV